ncbi:MAG TPA: hypothetical protein VFE05_14325 [Longimicrobiaceae bacterium]|jgi:hypothetical protein|nr:hypothetical protein [Longimicrobiaceae bacterium]
MKHGKLRLDIEHLTVDSFATSADAKDRLGTVHGHYAVPPAEPASDYFGVCDTYNASCHGSCQTCADSCYATCAATCYSCNYTCQLSCHSKCYEPA